MIIPDAPVVTLTVNGSNRFTLSWPEVAGAAGYEYMRKTGGGNWPTTWTDHGSDLTILDRVAADTEYCYRVRAYNAGHETGDYDEDCGTTEAE